MKLYIKSNVIDINVLRDLKSRFEVQFKETKDTYLTLDGYILSYVDKEDEDFEIDCSHWIKKIISKELKDISLSEVIDQLLIGVADTKLMQLEN